MTRDALWSARALAVASVAAVLFAAVWLVVVACVGAVVS